MDRTKLLYFKHLKHIHKRCEKVKKRIEKDFEKRKSTKAILIKKIKEVYMKTREKINDLKDDKLKDVFNLLLNHIELNKKTIQSINKKVEEIKK